MIYCFILYINGVKILKRVGNVAAADQILFMTVKNNKDVYSDLLIVRDSSDRNLVFLQERENLRLLLFKVFKQIEGMVLRGMHATI